MKAKPETVTAAELARRSDYSAGAITSWTRAGILTRTKGRYNLVESLEAIKRHEATRFSDGSHDSEELLPLKRQLLECRIAKLDHELAVAKGLTHSKRDCCQSLLAIHSVESTILHGLAGRLAAKYPEQINPQLREAIDSEIDNTIARLKVCLDKPTIFACPHCGQVVEQLTVKESQED
jgi:hypothetical protein